MQRQMEIYQGVVTGKRLSVPVPLALLEKKASAVVAPPAWDYMAGGAGGERTMKTNLEAFSQWQNVPRGLRDVSRRGLSVALLGARVPAPVLLGPIGVQEIIHPDSDVASARAAAALRIPFLLRTLSSRPIEEVAQAMGSGVPWFQLCWGKAPELISSMLQPAERAGYSALVVRLDTRSWVGASVTCSIPSCHSFRARAGATTSPIRFFGCG